MSVRANVVKATQPKVLTTGKRLDVVLRAGLNATPIGGKACTFSMNRLLKALNNVDDNGHLLTDDRELVL